MDTPAPVGLSLLREPFPAHQISKLPKPSKAQTEALKANFKLGQRCIVCGGWHQPEVVHLDYVGHAALTDRLLDTDPSWNWEPFAVSPDGLPVIDNMGGLWIRLTVLGVTRLGYGDAQGKDGPNAIKECIGDALRNAAMRFGAALDLWHKGVLHLDDDDEPEKKPEVKPVAGKAVVTAPVPFVVEHWLESLEKCGTAEELRDFKKRGMESATAAKNQTGWTAIRTEANRLAAQKGWA
jgi:hypothetical protein